MPAAPAEANDDDSTPMNAGAAESSMECAMHEAVGAVDAVGAGVNATAVAA